MAGSDKCKRHLFNPKARARAAVRAEVLRWGFSDEVDDPGEVLLKMVTQARVRSEHYAHLIEEAYEAAERLKAAHEAHEIVADTETKSFVDSVSGREVFESAAMQAAKADLDRIFTLGGPAALIGHTYSTSNAGALYASGEAIRGLVELEFRERKMCADLCVKAIAAGLAERSVRMAERMGSQLADVLRALLSDPGLALTAEARKAAPEIIRRHLASVAS